MQSPDINNWVTFTKDHITFTIPSSSKNKNFSGSDMIFPIQHEGISKIETYSKNGLINVLVISTSSDVFEHMKKELNRINDTQGYRINFNEPRFVVCTNIKSKN